VTPVDCSAEMDLTGQLSNLSMRLQTLLATVAIK